MMRVYVRVDGFCKAAALYCEYVTEGEGGEASARAGSTGLSILL
jgi:hypothetical protein